MVRSHPGSPNSVAARLAEQVEDFRLAAAPRRVVQQRIADKALAAIPLDRPQIHGELSLCLQGEAPTQGYAEHNALIEAAFAELRR